MRRAPATAKLNLALVVGDVRPDGKHEIVTVYQRVTLADRVAVSEAPRLRVDGFADDTLVRAALEALASAAGQAPRWQVRLTKRIPVAAGLGGGSSDAATALRLANATLPEPVAEEELHELAAQVGSDVPFFLTTGPQLGTGDGTTLEALDLPQDYLVVLLLPTGVRKESTAAVYQAFDRRGGAEGFEARRHALLETVRQLGSPSDLAALPPNDLARSDAASSLLELGAFRADVSGAGPAVYGLFLDETSARAAARAVRALGRAVVTRPCWYG